MATLMQKDVLIEAVASVEALQGRKIEKAEGDLSLTEDEKKFAKLRRHIYSTHHDKLDYQAIANECILYREMYSAMPDNTLYSSFSKELNIREE